MADEQPRGPIIASDKNLEEMKRRAEKLDRLGLPVDLRDPATPYRTQSYDRVAEEPGRA